MSECNFYKEAPLCEKCESHLGLVSKHHRLCPNCMSISEVSDQSEQSIFYCGQRSENDFRILGEKPFKEDLSVRSFLLCDNMGDYWRSLMNWDKMIILCIEKMPIDYIFHFKNHLVNPEIKGFKGIRIESIPFKIVDWVVNSLGIERFKEENTKLSLVLGKVQDKIDRLKDPKVFERTIHGFSVKQYLDLSTRRSIITMNGVEFESSPIGYDEGETYEEVAEFGFKILEEEGGIYNLLMFNNYLIDPKYIDNMHKINPNMMQQLNGIKVIDLEDM